MSMRRGLWLAAGVAAMAVGGASVVGCAAVRQLPNVPLTPTGPEAQPPVLGAFRADEPVLTAEDWTLRRAPMLRQTLLDEIYGAWPAPRAAAVTKRTILEPRAFGGLGSIEQIEVTLGDPAENLRFNIALALPNADRGPAPLIIAQNFCGNASALSSIEGVAETLTPIPPPCTSWWARPIVTAVFGRYANAPPFRELLERGYATAIFYAGDVVADTPAPAADAEAALRRLTPPGTPPEQRTGAIAAWAWLYARALDVLEPDPRIDAARTTVWGHSRNGKAALLAAAFDPRIEATIALQPGTAGASLQSNGVGEPIAAITETYPHWFAPAYRRYAGREDAMEVDQHQLLALIAPRAVLIGAARRDQWSDPHGAFRAAQAADPAYRLFGAPGFTQEGMRAPDFGGRLSFYMRGGLHGVHTEDWRVAFAFLDETFATAPSIAAQP